MPMTEEEKARVRANMDRPFTAQAQQAAPMRDPSLLPPGLDIDKLVSGISEGRPYLKGMGSVPQMAYPVPQSEIKRSLQIQAAKQAVKSSAPKPVSDTMKRDYSKIDAFEGMMNDLEKLSKNVRKGPMRGRYVQMGAKATGGSSFGDKGFLSEYLPDVGQEESINAVTYSDLRPGVAAGLYRAITGDDRISDTDAERRAMPFVPDLALSTEAFQKRLQFMKRAIQRKRQSIKTAGQLGGPNQSGDSAADFYSFMSEVMGESLDD